MAAVLDRLIVVGEAEAQPLQRIRVARQGAGFLQDHPRYIWNDISFEFVGRRVLAENSPSVCLACGGCKQRIGFAVLLRAQDRRP